MEFREDGYHATTAIANTDLSWAAFSKVVHFRDGFLLFQGPHLANWVPVRYLEDPDSLVELEALLRDMIDDHRIIEPVSRDASGGNWD
jgi:hypothetical protein